MTATSVDVEDALLLLLGSIVDVLRLLLRLPRVGLAFSSASAFDDADVAAVVSLEVVDSASAIEALELRRVSNDRRICGLWT